MLMSAVSATADVLLSYVSYVTRNVLLPHFLITDFRVSTANSDLEFSDR